jgi:outer membrane protein TolC
MVLMACLAALPGRAEEASPTPGPTPDADPVAAVVSAIADDDLRRFADEVLERNPAIAVSAADARAAAHRAPQAASLPDPVAGLTLFLSQPETRVGPQVATASVSQRFPWAGTLDVRERVALDQAAAAVARLHAKRLEVVTTARRLAAELAFLDAHEAALRDDLRTLAHFEELARARYATGQGLGQAVVRFHAEITRTEASLLEVETQRVALVSRLNALRDRSDTTPVPPFDLPEIVSVATDRGSLMETALMSSPEIAVARVSVDAEAAGIELAEIDRRPEFTAGLMYTLVEDRDDADPPDNGKDIVGLTGSLTLPIWNEPREAAVEEAVARRHAAEQRLRAVITEVDSGLSDLWARLPLIVERGRLFDRVLRVQAREALDSVLAAYTAGTADALDLLDAKRVLVQVEIASARARADWTITLAELEGLIGAPVREGGTP